VGRWERVVEEGLIGLKRGGSGGLLRLVLRVRDRNGGGGGRMRRCRKSERPERDALGRDQPCRDGSSDVVEWEAIRVEWKVLSM